MFALLIQHEIEDDDMKTRFNLRVGRDEGGKPLVVSDDLPYTEEIIRTWWNFGGHPTCFRDYTFEVEHPDPPDMPAVVDLGTVTAKQEAGE